MMRRQKLLAAIRNIPKDVRFSDACSAAEAIGFARAGGGVSHVAYAKAGERVILNFQNSNGRIPRYRARRLIEMLDKHGG